MKKQQRCRKTYMLLSMEMRVPVIVLSVVNVSYENEENFQNSLFHNRLLNEIEKEITRNNTSYVRNICAH